MPHTPSLCLALILGIPRVWSLMLPKEKMRGLGRGGGAGGGLMIFPDSVWLSSVACGRLSILVGGD